MDYRILSSEQISDGTVNDNPVSVVKAELEDGSIGWAAGPHGCDSCAVVDQLEYVGHLLPSREEAVTEAESQIDEVTLDWDAATDDAVPCPGCGGEAHPLGVLGDLVHYRCRDCGGQHSS